MKIKLYNTITFNKYKLKLTCYLEVIRYIVFLKGYRKSYDFLTFSHIPILKKETISC